MLLHVCKLLQHSSWLLALNSSVKIETFLEFCHYAGFFLLVGSITIVDLRILGIAGKRGKVTALAKQLFPWMWAGLLFALVSGFVMFTGDAVNFYYASLFRLKLLVFFFALLVGIIVQMKVPQWDQPPATSLGAKTIALLSLLLWFSVILISLEVPAINGVG